MKNQFTSQIVKLTFALMFVLLASSCSDDNETLDAAALAKDQINSEISAKGAKVVATVVVETFTVPSTVCVGVAIDFCFEAPIGTNLQVQQLIAGDWVQVYQKSQSTTTITCFPLTFANAITYQLRYKIGSGGFTQVPINVVDCSEGCDESFSYEANGGNSYTFTYISEVTLTDANVKFTCPHILGFTAIDGKIYTENPANSESQGSPTVLTWTGDIVACTPITFTLSFDPDCEQNAVGKLNLWNDFKVNGDSKKGTNETIKYNCN